MLHVNFQSDYLLITVYCVHVVTANNTRILVSEWINYILSFPKRYNECLLFLLFSHKMNAQVQECHFPLYSMSWGYFYIAERLYLGVGCGGGLRPPGGNKPILNYYINKVYIGLKVIFMAIDYTLFLLINFQYA